MWIAAYKAYSIGAAAAGQAAPHIFENHFLTCLRVGDEHGLLCAQHYDDAEREEWARKIGIGSKTFDMTKASLTISEQSLTIASPIGLRVEGQNQWPT
jgi:hypothetical protein